MGDEAIRLCMIGIDWDVIGVWGDVGGCGDITEVCVCEAGHVIGYIPNHMSGLGYNN